MGRKTSVAKVVILSLFAIIGFYMVYQGQQSSLREPSKEPTLLFQKTMKPSAGAQTGILKINMTPTKAFVVGDVITAKIEVDVFGVNWLQNETCNVDMLFPDSISYIDTWSNITYQDWTFVWWQYQTHDTVYAIYQKNITLWYIHEGFYGVNITVWQPELGAYGYNKYHYSDLVQIKPYSYLEEQRRTVLAEALNIEILGLTVVFVGPVVVQIVDSIQELRKSTQEQTRKREAVHTLQQALSG
jgi:hypothetical protein